jgi:hypothetical protein
MLTPANCRSEDVGVVPIVISELKFRDVQREIFAAYLVITAHNAALNQRPEALNRVGVDRADNVLAKLVIDNAVTVSVAGEIAVAGIGVGAEQADFVGNGFSYEILDRCHVGAENHAGNDVTLASDRADNRRLKRIVTATARAASLVQMTVFIFPADVGFVYFDDAAELLDVLDQRGADFVTHQPRGFVGTEAHVAHDLQCAHAFLAGQHQVNDFEPVAERLVGVLEDSPGDMGEPITVRGTLFALPMPLARFEVIDFGIAAARAMHAIWPSTGDQIGFAGFLVREGFVKLSGGHLRNGLRASGHGFPLSVGGYCHA